MPTPPEEPATAPVQQHNHTESPRLPVVTHKQKWFEDDDATRLAVNGNYSHCNWAIKTCHNDVIVKGGGLNHLHSWLDYFS